jgi:hypothetical protein
MEARRQGVTRTPHLDDEALITIAANDSASPGATSHIQQCSICTHELEVWRRISDLARVTVDTVPPAREDLVVGLLKQLDSSSGRDPVSSVTHRPALGPSGRGRWARWLIPAPIFIAAVVVLAVVLGIGSSAPSDALVLKAIRSSPSVAAKAYQTVRFTQYTVLRAPQGYTAIAYGSQGAVSHRSNSFELTQKTVEAGGPPLDTYTTLSDGSLVYLNCYVDGQIVGRCVAYPAQRGTPSDTLSLGYLGAASGPLVRLGKREIDGVETTGYRVTVPKSALLQNVVPSERSLVQYGNSATFDVRVDVWSDSRDLPRELVFTYLVRQPNLPSVLHGTATEKLSYSKTPLRVRVPPSNIVTVTPNLSAAIALYDGDNN